MRISCLPESEQKNMLLSGLIVAIIAFTSFKSSGAGVAIQKKDIEGRPCECGESLTLSCKFDKNTFAVAWMKPSDISPIAQCIRKVCKLNPAYNAEYSISFDMEQSVFNLTLQVVTMKINGSRLVCSDGANIDSHIIKVREYEPLLVEDSKNGTIKAISGCVSYDTEVSFKWMKIVDCINTEEEISIKVNDNRTETCSGALECNNGHQKQYTELVRAKRSEKGQCLKIVAIYGEERNASYQTNLKFTLIGGKDLETIDSSMQYSAIPVAMIGLAVFSIVVIVYLSIKIRKAIGRKCYVMSENGDEESSQPSSQKGSQNNDEAENLITENEPSKCMNEIQNKNKDVHDYETPTEVKAKRIKRQQLLSNNDEEVVSTEQPTRNICTTFLTKMGVLQDSAVKESDETVQSKDTDISPHITTDKKANNEIDFPAEYSNIGHSLFQDKPENDENETWYQCLEEPAVISRHKVHDTIEQAKENKLLSKDLTISEDHKMPSKDEVYDTPI